MVEFAGYENYIPPQGVVIVPDGPLHRMMQTARIYSEAATVPDSGEVERIMADLGPIADDTFTVSPVEEGAN